MSIASLEISKSDLNNVCFNHHTGIWEKQILTDGRTFRRLR